MQNLRWISTLWLALLMTSCSSQEELYLPDPSKYGEYYPIKPWTYWDNNFPRIDLSNMPNYGQEDYNMRAAMAPLNNIVSSTSVMQPVPPAAIVSSVPVMQPLPPTPIDGRNHLQRSSSVISEENFNYTNGCSKPKSAERLMKSFVKAEPQQPQQRRLMCECPCDPMKFPVIPWDRNIYFKTREAYYPQSYTDWRTPSSQNQYRAYYTSPKANNIDPRAIDYSWHIQQ